MPLWQTAPLLQLRMLAGSSGVAACVLLSDCRRVATTLISAMLVRGGRLIAQCTASAMSSGWMAQSLTSRGGGLGRRSRMGVSTMPGRMLQTRMPLPCSSRDAPRARPSNADLEAP
ncbi:hypothetical protein D3C85_1638990 [compost metagenome]